jgi:hypothetical protein
MHPKLQRRNGSIVQCADGEWSHSGGHPGVCSGHGASKNKVTKGPVVNAGDRGRADTACGLIPMDAHPAAKFSPPRFHRAGRRLTADNGTGSGTSSIRRGARWRLRAKVGLCGVDLRY